MNIKDKESYSWFTQADAESIAQWIRDRNSGKRTPFDKCFSSRQSTSSVLVDTFNALSGSDRQKMAVVFDTLIRESLRFRNESLFSEIISAIARTNSPFPKDELIHLLLDKTSPLGMKGLTVSLFQGEIANSREIQDLFSYWYWQDPIPIGTRHAFQLYVGLLETKPGDFAKLLQRLLDVTRTLPDSDKPDINYVWTFTSMFCSERQITQGLASFSQELQDSYKSYKINKNR